MQSILVDAGPLIALFRRRDAYHSRALSYIKNYKGRLVTTWPVITEVMHELNRPDVQEKFLLWIERGGLQVVDLGEGSITSLIGLIKKYADLSMDLADATLMLYAEKAGIREVLSIDSDFNVYRTAKKDYLVNVFTS